MLGPARARRPDATVITTNAGIKLFGPQEPPDYYMVFDMVSTQRHYEDGLKAQGWGTRLVTLEKSPRSLKLRRTDHYDVFLPIARGSAPKQFIRGEYADCGFSGLYCTMFAVNNGAADLTWVGMEGYRSQPGATVPDHFDGYHGPEKGVRQTQDVLGPFLQSVVEACPDVRFTFYGQPLYRLDGDNLTVISGGGDHADQDA